MKNKLLKLLINFIPFTKYRKKMRLKCFLPAQKNNMGEYSYSGAEFISPSAKIGKYCSIASGAVVGANAVVTKDIPPYAIVAGVPARIIKFRFDEQTREQLLHSQWWDIPHDVLLTFDVQNIGQFLKQVKDFKNEK